MRSIGAITPQQVALHQAAQAAKAPGRPVTRGKGSMGRTRVVRPIKSPTVKDTLDTLAEQGPPPTDGEMSPATAASMKQLMKENLKPGPFKPCAHHQGVNQTTGGGMDDLHVDLAPPSGKEDGDDSWGLKLGADQKTITGFRVFLPILKIDPKAKRVRVETVLRRMEAILQDALSETPFNISVMKTQALVLRAHIAWLETPNAPVYINLNR